jgi:hypothetical protein
MFRPDQPLWLPPGSVRAVIALAATAAFLLGQITWEPAAVVWLFYFKDRPVAGPSGTDDV